jgi:hypothetical protein
MDLNCPSYYIYLKVDKAISKILHDLKTPIWEKGKK